MASTEGALLKELHRLTRDIGKLTVGQARVDDIDMDGGEENNGVRTFSLFITPNDGPYRRATCKFLVEVPASYPEQPPMVRCKNSIYHPNIDVPDDETQDASICVNLLDSDWQAGVGLDGCVMAVLFLFYNPNPDDALSVAFNGDSAEDDDEDFEKKVRRSLRGEEVEGMVFDKLLDDDDEEEEEKDESDVGDSTDSAANGSVTTEGVVTDTGDSQNNTDDKTDATADDNNVYDAGADTQHDRESNIHVNFNSVVNMYGALYDVIVDENTTQIQPDMESENASNVENQDDTVYAEILDQSDMRNNMSTNTGDHNDFVTDKIVIPTTNNSTNSNETKEKNDTYQETFLNSVNKDPSHEEAEIKDTLVDKLPLAKVNTYTEYGRNKYLQTYYNREGIFDRLFKWLKKCIGGAQSNIYTVQGQDTGV